MYYILENKRIKAVLNCSNDILINADYFIRSNIKIEFFPNEVKVTNPVGIFNSTMEDIMNGVQTYRNPKLVHILDKLNFIENYGTEISRTMLAYNNSTKNLNLKLLKIFSLLFCLI